MDRAEKQAEIEYLTGCFSRSQVALCADYRGLTVAEVTELRSKLREKGAFARVSKNTLCRISAERVFKDARQEELKKFIDILEGPSMLVFSYEDPVTPAKVVSEFVKGHQNLQVRGGWLEGAFVGPDGVEMLSKMPGREETLAKLLALMNAPATQLLRLMNAPGTQLARVLDAHRQNLEKKAA